MILLKNKKQQKNNWNNSKMTFVGLCQYMTSALTWRTFPERGSIIRSFLSLQLVASKLPSVLKDIQRTTSGWLSIIFTATPSSRFQIRICYVNNKISPLFCHSDLVLVVLVTLQSYPALSRIPLQVGCHSISPALRLWPIRIIRASVMFLLKPPSGICQILTWSSKVKGSFILVLFRYYYIYPWSRLHWH